MVLLTAAVAALLCATPAPKKTQLKIQIKPASAVLFVDGKRRGTGAHALTVPVEPGRHILKVVLKKDEHEEMVVVKKGEIKQWSWEFEDDRRDTHTPSPEPASAPELAPSDSPKETPDSPP